MVAVSATLVSAACRFLDYKLRLKLGLVGRFVSLALGALLGLLHLPVALRLFPLTLCERNLWSAQV
jgi:hypothetical protein